MIKRINLFKRTVIGILIALLILFQGPVARVLAVPSAPAAPSAPSAPSVPDGPTESMQEPPAPPQAPDAPTDPSSESEISSSFPNSPDSPDSPTMPETDGHGSGSEGSDGSTNQIPDSPTQPSQPQRSSSQENVNSEASQISGNSTGGQIGDGQVGSTEVNTGDATNSAIITADANNNLSATPTSDSGGVRVANEGNGSNSDNSGSVKLSEENSQNQINSAQVANTLNQVSNTGENSASRNVGDSTITTGDANVTGTVITSVNTNVDGVTVSEFNVVDDHIGDIVLDLGTSCLGGCGGGSISAVNSGNGDSSTNQALIDSNLSDTSFQQNDATVENGMILIANSGGNQADRNTAGDSTITTGDANVSANVLTFANNNLSGNVVYAVVNIFGDLVGNIILPESFFASCCTSDLTAENIGNGDSSVNTSQLSLNSTDQTSQTNNSDIDNNLILSATTGENLVNRNTNGNNSVTTGDSSILAQVVNFANSNIIGGNWWLVIINEGGKWIGKILGASDDAHLAGSDGFEFSIDEAGEILVTNLGNGSDSTNTGSVTQSADNSVIQVNNANIVNNLILSATSGENSASRNTGGNSTITTGDANIIANIVNFVNNNIVGTGRLFVNVVNVFGSWVGNFVGPGQTNEASAQLPTDSNKEAIGGIPAANPGDSGVGSDSHSDQVPQGQNSQGSTSSIDSSNALSSVIESSETPVTFGKVAFTISGNQGGDEKIALAQSINQNSGKKALQINLAWATLLLPLGLIYFFVRRRFLNSSAHYG